MDGQASLSLHASTPSMQFNWASSQHGSLRVIRHLTRQLASSRTGDLGGSRKASYDPASEVTQHHCHCICESKFHLRASPSSRGGGDNTKAWILGSLVYWWCGGVVGQSLETSPLPSSKLLICHWPELCHSSIPQPITAWENGVSKRSHHTTGWITISGQHHCIMRSRQGGLTLAFPILLWIHCGWFLQWSPPPKPKHLLISFQDGLENQQLRTEPSSELWPVLCRKIYCGWSKVVLKFFFLGSSCPLSEMDQLTVKDSSKNRFSCWAPVMLSCVHSCLCLNHKVDNWEEHAGSLDENLNQKSKDLSLARW